MLIAFDGRWFNQVGIGNHVLPLVNALIERQGKYRLLLFEHPSNPVPTDSDDVERIPMRYGRYTPAGQLEFARKLSQHRVALVHCPFYVVPLLAACPVIVTIHDLMPFLFPLHNAVKRAVIQAGHRMGVRKASGIIACSERTASDCSQILHIERSRMTLVYNGGSPDFSPHAESGELEYLRQRYGVRPPYVFLLGSKHWRTKGFGFGLQALARSRKSLEFQIVWAGAEQALTEDPDAEGIDISEILKCGFVPNSDLAKLYRHAHAFLLPSWYEGFGRPLLEAMACGCPVVCSDGGALPEVAGLGAVVVPHDVDRMSDAINGFLLDHNLRTRQKKLALGRAAEFSWDRSVKVVLGLYEQILGLPSGALSPDSVVQERHPSVTAVQNMAAIHE